MVNLQGKETTALKTIQQSLSDNLNIITADSRLKTISDKIADSRYRIKDLSTITDTALCNRFTTIDGKLFILPNRINAGSIEVRDYQTDTLLKTISDGANVGTLSICYDDQFIYINKVIETISDKKYRDVYIRKYNRCTLELVLESPILYTGISGVSFTNSSNIFSIIENEEFLYMACVQVMQIAGVYSHIRKIRKSDFSLVASREWNTPLFITKHTSGLFISGVNTFNDPKYRRVDFLDWDLNIIQTFPQTTLTIGYFRCSVYKDDYLFAGNDSGVLVKYQISTNTIVAETQISEVGIISNIMLINNDFLLLQTNNTSKIILYDFNLNFIKMWDFYNTTTTNGNIINDNNNTIWTQSASQPNKIYKKQFIDLTKDIT